MDFKKLLVKFLIRLKDCKNFMQIFNHIKRLQVFYADF